jgi:hypothetical protein
MLRRLGVVGWTISVRHFDTPLLEWRVMLYLGGILYFLDEAVLGMVVLGMAVLDMVVLGMVVMRRRW